MGDPSWSMDDWVVGCSWWVTSDTLLATRYLTSSCEDMLRSLRKKGGSSVIAGVPQVYQTHIYTALLYELELLQRCIVCLDIVAR